MDHYNSIGQKMLLAFEGFEPSPKIISAINDYRPGGLTLFRHLNIDNPIQVRTLTKSLQDLAKERNLPPLLIAADQEGGQLTAIGEGTTQIPGNMALGAVGSLDLSREAGVILGKELSAQGINVNYAPVCDVNSNPKNPVIGIRSFGEDPNSVAGLAAAMVEGIQSTGVAATGKHFPGHGDTSGDSHHVLPYADKDLNMLHQVEFPPFVAVINSDVRLIMSAHLGVPSIDGPDAPAATLSSSIMQDILREELGFDGVIVTDAMDMKAIQQGDKLRESVLQATTAGTDLLLLTTNVEDWQRTGESLIKLSQDGKRGQKTISASLARISRLKEWVSLQPQPGIEIIGCEEHQAKAQEIANRSITLVRNESDLLPLKLNPDQRIAVVVPQPVDLTPADTSSYITPKLCEPVRKYHPLVDEFIISYAPADEEIADTVQQLANFDLIIFGTINALESPNQAELVRQVVRSGTPAVIAALRLPYDLSEFPEVSTYICTYSILEPSMNALAKALFGEIEFQGHLPVTIPGLYEIGHAAGI